MQSSPCRKEIRVPISDPHNDPPHVGPWDVAFPDDHRFASVKQVHPGLTDLAEHMNMGRSMVVGADDATIPEGPVDRRHSIYRPIKDGFSTIRPTGLGQPSTKSAVRGRRCQ
jgi:hypothetical protein